MFLGEYACFLGFLYLLWRRPEQLQKEKELAIAKGMKVSYNKIYFAIPGLLDLLGSSCSFFGITMATASTAQMMSAAGIFFTGILSYFFLKRRYTKLQVTGIVCLIAGVILVGLGSILKEKVSLLLSLNREGIRTRIQAR